MGEGEDSGGNDLSRRERNRILSKWVAEAFAGSPEQEAMIRGAAGGVATAYMPTLGRLTGTSTANVERAVGAMGAFAQNPGGVRSGVDAILSAPSSLWDRLRRERPGARGAVTMREAPILQQSERRGLDIPLLNQRRSDIYTPR